MHTMRREGLTDDLTNDKHFEHEGFRAVDTVCIISRVPGKL
jgi:hypothetical protein